MVLPTYEIRKTSVARKGGTELRWVVWVTGRSPYVFTTHREICFGTHAAAQAYVANEQANDRAAAVAALGGAS